MPTPYNDTITIITVVYNGADMIEKTIQSVINQNYSNIEYIVIDGGSDDGTVDIIKKYESRIHSWISEPDKGVYDAMNKGLQKASGKWINYMNAGDYFFSEETISTLFKEAFDYNKYAIIYGDAEFRTTSLSYIIQASDICNTNEFMPFSHQAAFFRKDVIQSIGFNLKYKITADAELCLRMLKKGFKFKRIPVVVCSYNAEGGLSVDNDVQRSKELIAMQAELNGIDPHSAYFKTYIRKAYIRQFIKKMLPAFLWNKIRVNKIKKSIFNK